MFHFRFKNFAVFIQFTWILNRFKYLKNRTNVHYKFDSNQLTRSNDDNIKAHQKLISIISNFDTIRLFLDCDWSLERIYFQHWLFNCDFIAQRNELRISHSLLMKLKYMDLNIFCYLAYMISLKERFPFCTQIIIIYRENWRYISSSMLW